jgi:hypothetical protein
MHTMRFVVGVAAAVSGACVSLSSEPELGVATQAETCTTNVCGENSPVIGGVAFAELHLGGQTNSQGVRISGVVSPSAVPMALQLVEGDRLRGVVTGTGEVLEHDDLSGSRIDVTVNGASFEIYLRVALSEEFWVRPELLPTTATFPIEMYDLRYHLIDSPRIQALCSEGDGDPKRLTALVFAGDLYNPDTKAITVGPETDGWLNIACTGSAVYKMHKSAHTSAAQARLGIPTTLAQRRAMLNAWTANVCGNGRSFTRAGKPITLHESIGLLPPSSPYHLPSSSIEAVWTEGGAVCLDVPRRANEVDGLKAEILAECAKAGHPILESCGDWGVGDGWAAHGHVLTGTP